MQEIINEVNQFLAKSVDPIQKRFLFQGRPSEAALKDTPMILMLGNHSSGKSSFINHFIQSDVQLTGMAPTDEDFTILRYGPTEKERPGSSMVSNPELGYEGLSQFGPRFLSHLKMKTLFTDRLSEVSLVDTPGMIDSADSQAHRGFDFQGVVRWFAERADLIMLFFDPERPGTTAETLKIYTESLCDFDHKLLVVLNKVDQFRKLSDFARCYGTLCWNLGKVMRTKDLPQIYVTYLPIKGVATSPLPMEEFDRSRLQLLNKMEQTALQRADNILTDVTIYLDRLLLHTQVLDGARRWLSKIRLRTYTLATFISGGLSAYLYLLSPLVGKDPIIQYLSMGGGTLVTFFIGSLIIKMLTTQRQWWSTHHLPEIFEQFATDHRVRNERYEHLKAHWDLIGSQTIRALKDLGISQLPKIKKREATEIIKWLEERLPQLRRDIHLAEDAATQSQLSQSAQPLHTQPLHTQPLHTQSASPPSPPPAPDAPSPPSG